MAWTRARADARVPIRRVVGVEVCGLGAERDWEGGGCSSVAIGEAMVVVERLKRMGEMGTRFGVVNRAH